MHLFTSDLLLILGEISLLKEHTFCNFEYLLALIHSTSIDNAIGILESTLRQVLDPEIDLIYRTLLISRDVLLDNPIQLAVEMISRLRNSKGELYSYYRSTKYAITHTIPPFDYIWRVFAY
jgi:hypothetical protein